jgi:multicomponent Na+:H+ antiporter subunit D
MGLLLVLPVVIPLAASALLMLGGKIISRLIADTLSVAVAASVVALDAVCLVRSFSTPPTCWLGSWAPVQGFPIGIVFQADPFSLCFACFSAFICGTAFLYSWHYFESAGTLFHAITLIFLAGTQGFLLTGDLFNMFVFLELISIAAFSLTGHKTEEAGAIQGAINFAVTNTVCAVFMLFAIGMLYAQTQSLTLDRMGQVLSQTRITGAVAVSLLFLLITFFNKAAIVPFHFWVADAYAVAPVPVTILFSAIMVEFGIFATIRTFIPLFGHCESLHPAFTLIVLVFGSAAAILGAIMCFLQRHIKRLLAYSTISHSGMMLIAAALFSPRNYAGLLSYLLSHGVIMSALFACTGIVLHATGTVDEFESRGKGTQLRVVKWTFIIAALGLASMPPFGTAFGKALIEHEAQVLHLSWISWIYAIGAGVTSASVLRVAASVFFGYGPVSHESASFHSESSDIEEEFQTPRPFQPALFTAIPVAMVIIGLALGIVPLFFQSTHIDTPVYSIDASKKVLYAVFEPISPGEMFGLRNWRPLILALVLFGMSMVPHKSMRSARTFAMKKLFAGIRFLRALHSGSYGDYVAWIVAGAVCMGFIIVLNLR